MGSLCSALPIQTPPLSSLLSVASSTHHTSSFYYYYQYPLTHTLPKVLTVAILMGSLPETRVEGTEDVHNTCSGPVVYELNRLHDQLRGKDGELRDAHAEIKALRLTQVSNNKAIQQLSQQLTKLEEKFTANESLLEIKNLEIKKLISEKKEFLAARYAAEATLRRVHVNQTDEDFIPIEAVIAPLEADIKKYKKEISTLQEDKKALERATKSKESALVEVDQILKSALERALIVEEVQNHNTELKRQLDICQEENKILDKINRQKVSEVEKLSQSIRELEESILSCGVVANKVRDYQRQIFELKEEKRMLERELARTKVSVNRVATAISNEWKSDNDKVIPVKQWLEERRFMLAETQKLKDMLSMSERTAKTESQLKEKFKFRLKTLEEGIKQGSSFSCTLYASHQSEQSNNSYPMPEYLNHSGVYKRSTSQPRGSICMRKGSPLRQPNVGTRAIVVSSQLKHGDSPRKKYNEAETLSKKNLWACKSKVHDNEGKENTRLEINSNLNINKSIDSDGVVDIETKTKFSPPTNAQDKETINSSTEDVVSGFLYDRLQREVINLQKHCEEKESTLNAKDEEIKVLLWKVNTLATTTKTRSRKIKRETTTREKDAISTNMVTISKENAKLKDKRTPKAS